MVELAEVSRAMVIGLGASGRAAAAALANHGIAVVAVDDDPDVPRGDLADAVQLHPGHSGVGLLDGIDLVVPSPGIPEHAAVLAQAARAGVDIWSEPELAWRLAPRRMVAITGTNGKTSTTELTTAMLVADGQDALACGNIGTPLVIAAPRSAPGATLVAELSSFQLRHAHQLRPIVGAVLNLAEDHLDWHGSRASYVAAKQRLWQAQGDDDWAVVNADDVTTLAMAAEGARGKVAVFSGRRLPGQGDQGLTCSVQTGVGVRDGKLISTIAVARGTILSLDDLPLTAPHHVANVAAAAAVAILAGAAHEAIAQAAKAYRPGRHRMEIVASAHGITWMNDSKATNPHAASAALDGVGSAVWIAGGLAKGVDLRPLGEHLSRVRHALLIGEAAPALAMICAAHGIAAETMESVEAACARAAALAQDGDTVLLAPACASFDQFRDYAERGERFAAAARLAATTT
ncbi:MAG: UDP-N-acetylmuramoylalanine--D-glutamate ligase [Glaciecola sp.]